MRKATSQTTMKSDPTIHLCLLCNRVFAGKGELCPGCGNNPHRRIGRRHEPRTYDRREAPDTFYDEWARYEGEYE